jgi:PKD repeat protein
MIFKRRFLFCLVSVSFFWMCRSELSFGQCMLYPVSINDRIQLSTAIIEGHVISQNTFWNSSGTLLYTANTIEVYKDFKGNVNAQQVQVITEGGTLGGSRHVVEPSPDLYPGFTGVFFLQPSLIINGPGTIPLNLRFESVSSSLGCIKYDLKAKKAFDAFTIYNDVDIDLILVIATALNKAYVSIGTFDINATGPGNGGISLLAPSITGISPVSVPAGRLNAVPLTLLTITGTGFTTNTGPALLEFPDANSGSAGYISTPASHIQTWTNTQITCWVPTGAGSGFIRITDNTGVVSVSPVSLSVTYNESNVTSGVTNYLPDLVNDNGSGGFTYLYNSTFNGNAPAVAAFQRALSTWRCGTFVNFTRLLPMVASSLTCQANDGTNLVTFDGSCSLPAGVLGVSYSYYSNCSTGVWYLTENDLKFRTNGTGGINWNYGPVATIGGLYDFESVCLHELGHSHQLGHTVISPVPGVMNWNIGANTDRRALLASSEIAGGNDILGRSTVNNTCGPTGMTLVNSGNCQLAAPTANFSGTPLTGCNSLNVTFTNLSTGNPTSWNWTFTGGVPATFSGANPPAISYASPGTYNVKLIVTNVSGTDTMLKTAYITVNSCPPPVADFSANPVVSCPGANIGFTDLSTGTPTAWSWLFPGGTPASSNLPNPVVSYAAPGVYNVQLTATNGAGSSIKLRNNYITINSCPPLPVPAFTGAPLSVCIGQNVTFTSQSTGIISTYQWSFPGGTPATSFNPVPVVTYAASGVYPVTLVAGNMTGTASLTKNAYITVNACNPPVANFSGGPLQICSGQSVNFIDLSTNSPASYAWTFTGGIPATWSTATPPAITYNSTTGSPFTVSLTVTNAFGSNTKTTAAYVQVDTCPPPGTGLIVNDGGFIRIQPGVTLTVQGGVINQSNVSTGNFDNNGVLTLTGDWTNNSGSGSFINASTGSFQMIGSAQLITGNSSTDFNKLVLAGTGVKSMTVNAETDTLLLNDRELATNDNIMYVTGTSPSAIQRTGANTSSGTGFVSSTGNGRLWWNTAGTTNYLFPVGSSGPPFRYRPISIAPSSASQQTFAVRFVNNDPSIDSYNRVLRDPSLGNINPFWYYKLSRISGANSSVGITMNYDFLADNIISYGNLLMTEWGYSAPYIWKDMSAVSYTANSSPNLATLTKSSWNNFNTENFSLATFSSPLPVELLSFEAICNGSQIILKWSTASEANSGSFEVERSEDGINFLSISTIQASGNSSSVLFYSSMDIKPINGKAYYRLKEFDNDGKVAISEIIMISCSASGSLSLFPNPANEVLTIKLTMENSAHAQLKIYDKMGQLVMSRQNMFLPGQNVIEWNLKELASGVYTFVIESENEKWTEKLVKVN